MPALPAIQFRPFFRPSRAAAVVPGSTGAEDLALLVPAAGVISAGKPPIAPALVSEIEMEFGLGDVGASSGWRCTRPGRAHGQHWNGGVSVSIEWPVLTREQWTVLKAWLLDEVGLGGEGGSLRAITVEIDGAEVADSAVDVRLVDLAGDIETLLVRVAGSGPGAETLYRFGPVRAMEVA